MYCFVAKTGVDTEAQALCYAEEDGAGSHDMASGGRGYWACLCSPEGSLLQDEERLWTELINKYDGSTAPWRADIVGRAYGNRGNARSRQGKMDIALVDYNRAIQICPWSVDPVLNRFAADSTSSVLCY